MKTIPKRSSGATACKFCRDPIHTDARICKACGEPQEVFRRVGWLISGMLSLLVALGSLGIAHLQYSDAKDARVGKEEAMVDAAEASVDVVAAEAAVDRIVTTLDEGAWAELSERWSPTLEDESTLEHELQERPTDVTVRRDLLLQEALTPQGRSQQ